MTTRCPQCGYTPPTRVTGSRRRFRVRLLCASKSTAWTGKPMRDFALAA